MKQNLLTITLLLFTFTGFGQCPTEIINLNSQAEVDAFATNYPSCTEINFPLFISGNDITNLNGLSQLTSINSILTISDTSLENFNGLHNIENIVDGLYLFNNNTISNMHGFEGLIEIGDISFESNQNLINMEGFENVVTALDISIEFNNSFLNFEGFDSLISCDGFRVTSCPSFINFLGMESLQTSTASVRIVDNTNLESFSGLENLNSINPGHLYIENNPNLQGFTAFENLTFVRNYIWVLNCDSVENLDGFEGVEQLDYSFRLIGNQNLNSISGFSNLSGTYDFGIKIKDNPNLSMCNINTVCENLYVDEIGYFEIENNGSGCNSVEEVADSCGVLIIPDVNLLNALLDNDPVIDINNDNLIQYSEAGTFTGALNLENKQISDFEGLQAFINATSINVSGNFMSFLNLNQNLTLDTLDFSNSPDLESVNLKNGNNTAITNFNGVDCPSLEFICVDDVAFAEANFTSIDSHVVFVEDCEILAVEAFNLGDAVSVFPNPVSETLTISTTSNINFTKAEIYSIHGQKLVETSATQINLSDFSTGIYFVKVISAQGSITKKIIKE